MTMRDQMSSLLLFERLKELLELQTTEEIYEAVQRLIAEKERKS